MKQREKTAHSRPYLIRPRIYQAVGLVVVCWLALVCVPRTRADLSHIAVASAKASTLPYGYVMGLVGGTGLAYLTRKHLSGLADDAISALRAR